jgi:hypothetical protein
VNASRQTRLETPIDLATREPDRAELGVGYYAVLAGSLRGQGSIAREPVRANATVGGAHRLRVTLTTHTVVNATGSTVRPLCVALSGDQAAGRR